MVFFIFLYIVYLVSCARLGTNATDIEAQYVFFRNKRALSNSRERSPFRGVVPRYLSRFQ